VSLLEHHLRAYTRANNTDFFIHKDLKGFLERELDFYLKNEVLNLDELEAGGEARAESWFQTLRAIKGIGRKIIAFVAQIENFQKRLFEKKKFVTEVNYCVTLDRVSKEHRGASSEANKWLGYRAKLAETGFTFEYSATFGQAMTAAGNEEMTEEYGKAILFDYSYKYFYGDGFGKDFEVLNLRQKTTDEQAQTLLLANLLAFHEQKRAFQTKAEAMVRYHLADPLWIFVGSTVNTGKQAEGSDVLRSVPPSLNGSEQKFMNDLVEFCKSKPEVLKDKELFLLRNLSRGKGIGFFEDTGFYPDFILWITEGNKQRLVFIEPHGMKLEQHPSTNPKVNLHLKMKAQESEARKKAKLPTLSLDAFIISATPFDDLCKQHGVMWNRVKYAESHIFFGDEKEYGQLKAIVG
jgi:hypothetical protein